MTNLQDDLQIAAPQRHLARARVIDKPRGRVRDQRAELLRWAAGTRDSRARGVAGVPR